MNSRKASNNRAPSHVRSLMAFIEGLGAKVRNRLSGRLAYLDWSVGARHFSIKVPISAPRLDRIVSKLQDRIREMFSLAGTPATA